MATRSRALSSYRTLLRSIRVVFGADASALRKCRADARGAFALNAGERDAATIERQIADAAEASDFIRQHIAQAKLNQHGRYELQLHPSFVEQESASVQVTDAHEAAAGKPGSGKAEGGCCGGGCH